MKFGKREGGRQAQKILSFLHFTLLLLLPSLSPSFDITASWNHNAANFCTFFKRRRRRKISKKKNEKKKLLLCEIGSCRGEKKVAKCRQSYLLLLPKSGKFFLSLRK